MMRYVSILFSFCLLSAPLAAQTLNLTSSLPADITIALAEAFDEQIGIGVSVHWENTGQATEQLTAAGIPEGDVLLTSDVLNLLRLQQLGHFQSSPLTSFPGYLRGEENQWVAISASVRLIIYTERQDGPVPRSYRDLAERSYFGGLCLSPARRAGNISLVTNSLSRMGRRAVENWLDGLAGNMAVVPLGHDYDQLHVLQNGECVAGLIPSDLYARLLGSSATADRELLQGLQVIAPSQPNLDFTFAAI